MGKSAPPPKAPAPYKTASAEAQFNRVDTYGAAGGGVRHGWTNDDGEFRLGMAPKGYQSAQKLIESQPERRMRRILEPASVALTKRIVRDDIKGLPDAARVQNFDDVASELYDAAYSRMQPDFERENDRMMTNLQARGIPIGSDAFGDVYRQQQQGVNDALTQLSAQATQAAGAEQSRRYGLDAASRSNAISELVAAMGGQYNPPSALPSGDVAGVDYGGMVQQEYQSKLDMWKYREDQKMQTMSAIGSLGGALLTKSDRRTKTDVVKVGRRGALTLYAFRYLWDNPGTMRVGYMAQEVKEHFPDAVGRVGAWLAVDYSKVPEVEAYA